MVIAFVLMRARVAAPSAPAVHAPDYVEITVELDSEWHARTRTNMHHRTVKCVAGTNDWYISGDFSSNADIEYWLIGTNVAERTTITSSMYLAQAEKVIQDKLGRTQPGTPAISYPRAGEQYTKIHPAPQGQPAGSGSANVVWLAFCSGNYLKGDGRQIPMPVGPPSIAFGYSDKTTVFDDTFGLPKTVDLYATNGQLVCEYEVLTATNFCGWNFPLKFRVTQYGIPARGAAKFGARTEVIGEVTSIKIGQRPILPDEVQAELNKARAEK
ncbi:MAG: hypothetical protein AB1705_16510 [Verrucomicrobiota bacterium]